jgi:hypothetical protein
MEFDPAKFKAVVHHIIWKAARRHKFGSTKLNKALWFADARLYMITGRSITGEEYVREKYGPVPRHIMPIIRGLERDGAINVIRSRGGGDNAKFMAFYEPDVSFLNGAEREALEY